MTCVLLPNNAFAITYEDTTQEVLNYNINNFYSDGNNIIINGWAITDRHQDLTGDNTHEFSLTLTNNNITRVYVGTLKDVDKTRLMRTTEQVNHCTTYYNNGNCHYKYTKVGFEFKIPLADLSADKEYALKLRIYEKLVKKGYQLSFYALGINDTFDKNGIRYQLYSDIHKTNVTVTATLLFVKSGPGTTYSAKTSNISCSGIKTLYWKPNGFFNNIIGASQTSVGSIDSELWLNVKYDYGTCIGGRARAINGTTYDGWLPWIYVVGGGTPAVIKTTSLNTVSIDEIKTYTAPKNTKTKVLTTITSTINQDITIKGYHNNKLVYNKVHNINGTKSFELDYVIPNDGTFKIEVISKYNTINKQSKIYVSSEKTYELDKNSSNKIITIDTPIMVLTNKNGKVTEYKEKIQLSAVPYEIDISQGRGLSGITSAISYWYPLEEFTLNSDYNVYALYPSSEKTQNYELVDGKVKVNLKKESIERKNSYDISYFHHPNILLSVIKGNLYNEALEGNIYYNGGGIWYPAWDDELGTYSYQYVGTNLGINKITIKRDLSYSIVSKMFDKENNKFIIRRVKTPSDLKLVYKKTFTYEQLKSYVRNN